MPIELTRIEEFALITLNRPEALNALSVQVVKDSPAQKRTMFTKMACPFTCTPRARTVIRKFDCCPKGS